MEKNKLKIKEGDSQHPPLLPPQQQQINNIKIIIQQQSSPNPNPPHPLFSGIV